MPRTVQTSNEMPPELIIRTRGWQPMAHGAILCQLQCGRVSAPFQCLGLHQYFGSKGVRWCYGKAWERISGGNDSSWAKSAGLPWTQVWLFCSTIYNMLSTTDLTEKMGRNQGVVEKPGFQQLPKTKYFLFAVIETPNILVSQRKHNK